MKDEIEQIRIAEQQSFIMIENARVQGEAMIEDAHKKAASLIMSRKQDAEDEISRLMAQMHHEAELEAVEYLDRSDLEAEQLKGRVEKKIPRAVIHIHRQILGEKNVLSGSDE
jgi:vacuolar-type H+-ATPase subunit H